MKCRVGCGACCIAPSISSPIPGMPNGKPAGMRCVQLSEDNRCLLVADSRRPEVCEQFRASEEVCGSSRTQAIQLLGELKKMTTV